MTKKRTLSSQDKQYLLNLKKKSNEDDVRYKEIIKNILLEDDVLIYLLNNKQLEGEEAENDDYYGINILPYYTIPDDQTKTENFICFETSFNEVKKKYDKLVQIKAKEVFSCILVGNKCDLGDELRKVSQKDAEDFANSKQIPFLEASALNKINVKESFVKVVHDLLTKTQEKNKAGVLGKVCGCNII